MACVSKKTPRLKEQHSILSLSHTHLCMLPCGGKIPCYIGRPGIPVCVCVCVCVRVCVQGGKAVN